MPQNWPLGADSGGVKCKARLECTHRSRLLASCASSMNALRVLRCHGLPPPQLHEVARSTTIASLMYASLWWGFSSEKDRSRMERLINKLKRSGFLPESATSAAALAGEADERLFRAVISDPYSCSTKASSRGPATQLQPPSTSSRVLTLF